MKKKMTYSGAGVDYKILDHFKRMAQRAARETKENLKRFSFSEAEFSRGESAYLIETLDSYAAHVEEGLGTKNLIADEMYRISGKSYYGHIAQDSVAMIVNDMITLGALPISVAMHLAVSDSGWFNEKNKCRDFIQGWKKACILSRSSWGGGETAVLKGIIIPESAIISGSAIGIIKPKKRLIRANIKHGDAIILIESSGIHANGITLVRSIADKLPNGYLTKLPQGQTLGETLLDPTYIYVPLMEECLNRGINIHYAVNITGHGWRKLMRALEPFAYIIEYLPKQLPIFDFLQTHGPVDDMEAYGNFNMGAGFALYVSEKEVKKVFDALESLERPNRFGAIYAGHIEKSSEKKVIIRPKGLEYSSRTLGIR